MNYGTSFLILANREQARKNGHQRMARLFSYAPTVFPNHIISKGLIPASQKALAVAKGLNSNMDTTNPNGCAIALGHPVGYSEAFIAIEALYELRRINGRYVLVTMCIGGGEGIACSLENPEDQSPAAMGRSSRLPHSDQDPS